MDKERGLNDSFAFVVRKPEPEKRGGVLAFFRSRFVTGLLVAFPLVVTIFFGRFLFDLVDRWADPISLQLFGRPVLGAGAALFVLTIFVLGVLAHNVIGRRVLRFGDHLFARIPVLRPIYVGAREVTRALGQDRMKNFRRVVLIPFPNEAVWAVGFVTVEYVEASETGPRKMVAVFMPTTPNPTTGFFLVYPESAVKNTTMTVEEAIRMVISGGLVSAAQGRVFPGIGEKS
jgi:uncharacterized membrane protein